MAKKKISELPAGSALTGVELVPVVQGGTTKRVTAQAIADLSNASSIGGGGTTNYVSKFTSGFNIGDSQIFDNGTSVGINTITPNASYRLDVNGFIRSTYLNINSALGGNIGLQYGGADDWAFGENSGEATRNFNIYNFNRTAIEFSINRASGAFTLNSLQGTGSRMVVASALGVLSTQAIPTGTITGSGTTNYLPKFTGSTAIGNSLVFDNGTNIGIGTTTGSEKLSVNGEVSAVTRFRLNPTTQTNQIIGDGTASNLAGANNLLLRNDSGSIFFASGSANVQMLLNTSGNFLLNTTTDAGYKLDVLGGSRFRGSSYGDNAINCFGANGANGVYSVAGGSAGSGIYGYTTDSSSFGGTFENTGGGFGLRVLGKASFNSSITAGDFITTSYGTARIQVTSTTNGANSGFRLSAKNSSGVTNNAGLYYFSGTTTANTFLSLSANDNDFQFNFLANGNVLIGTSTDLGYKLTIAGNSNSYSVSPHAAGIDIYSTGNIAPHFQTDYSWYTGAIGAGSFKMRLNSSGELGIGTTTPAGQLEVYTNAYKRFYVTYPSIYATQLNFGTAAYMSYDAGNATLSLFASDGTYGSLSFGAGNTQRMVITSAGNIGIGTASPTTYSLAGKHLEIFGGSDFSFIHNNTTSVKSFYASNEGSLLSALFTFSNHPLTFGTNNTERMRIFADGRIAIGTTTIEDSAKVQIDSTTQGFLPPRMPETDIVNMYHPVAGLLVYNTDINHMCMYDGSAWHKLSMSNM